VFQVNAEKKYNNQSELIDDMLDNVFTCMHELDVKPGNIIIILCHYLSVFKNNLENNFNCIAAFK